MSTAKLIEIKDVLVALAKISDQSIADMSISLDSIGTVYTGVNRLKSLVTL